MQRAAEIRRWGAALPNADELALVVSALERGELVAIPTETVYGIASRADEPAAVERLARVKGRDPAQPVTWHVRDGRQLFRLPRVSPMARRLCDRYWPGPLTLVLPGVAQGIEAAAKDGWTGIRCPAHPATEALLGKAPFPVVASSANLHGKTPLFTADEVLAEFGSELAIVIDGGPARLRESSVVLKVGPGSFQLLREGILDLKALRETAGLRIAFVCTGNTCRSPMAEGLARAALARRLNVPAERIGEFAMPGASASEHAVHVLGALGIDLSEHRSRYAVPEEITAFDRVYAMTQSHLDALRLMLPPGKDKNCDLLDPDGGDIGDPVGGPMSEYERAAGEIAHAIERRLDEWA
jgi:L-threonylcarbamoyladenylate synthase